MTDARSAQRRAREKKRRPANASQENLNTRESPSNENGKILQRVHLYLKIQLKMFGFRK